MLVVARCRTKRKGNSDAPQPLVNFLTRHERAVVGRAIGRVGEIGEGVRSRHARRRSRHPL